MRTTVNLVKKRVEMYLFCTYLVVLKLSKPTFQLFILYEYICIVITQL